MKDRKTLLIVAGIGVVLIAVLGYSFIGSADSGAATGNRVVGGAGLAGDSILEGSSTDQPMRRSGGTSAGSSSRIDASVASSPEIDEDDSDSVEVKSKKKAAKKRRRKSKNRSEVEEEEEEPQEKILRPSKGIPIGG